MSRYTQTWGRAAGYLHGSTDKSLFYYFFRGDQRIQNIGDFITHWRALSHATDLSAKELAIILYKIATLLKKYNDSALSQNISHFLKKEIDIWEERMIPKLWSSTPKGFSTSLWSYATLAIEPSPDFMQEWQHCTLEKLREENQKHFSDSENDFNPQNLSNILWAFATLQIEPSSDFIEEWQACALKKLSDFNAQNLGNSLWAFATLAIEPSPDFMQEWQHCALEKLPTFEQQHISNSLWAMSVIDLISQSYDGHDMGRILLQNTKADPYSKLENLHQLKTAAIWLNLPCSFDLPEESENSSSLEGKFKRLLEQHGYVFDDNCFIVDLNHKLDFALFLPNGAPIGIELDGYMHFVRPLASDDRYCNYNGNTLMQSALICKTFPQISFLRIAAADFNRLKKEPVDVQASALATLVSLAEAVKPGVHRVCYEGRQMSLQTITSVPAPMASPIPLPEIGINPPT